MLIADVIELVEDAFTSETLDPGRLERAIGLAVKYYSRYNPFEKPGTLTLVANQQDYDVATDCILIAGVDYWPAGDLAGIMRAGQEYAELMREETRYRFPSDRVIRNIERTSRADRQGIRWEPLGSRKVRLHPAPSAVDTINYQYYAIHALDAAGDDYPTIPDEDIEIIRDLTLAQILASRGWEYTVEPDYAEGLQRITKRFIPGNVKAAVSELRSSVKDKYGRGAIATQASIA